MGLDLVEPHGAFYAFPSISSTGLDDEAFAERLLMEEKVAVVPGSASAPAGAATSASATPRTTSCSKKRCSAWRASSTTTATRASKPLR